MTTGWYNIQDIYVHFCFRTDKKRLTYRKIDIFSAAFEENLTKILGGNSQFKKCGCNYEIKITNLL